MKISKAPAMNENVDELMMVVAKEANYNMSDLMRMDIGRFFRIVDVCRERMKERMAVGKS